MPSERDDDFVRARKEAAALLHLDFENLSPADSLRCDLVATLRSVIDDEQAKSHQSGSADLARLITATESLIKLLPARLDTDSAGNLAPCARAGSEKG